MRIFSDFSEFKAAVGSEVVAGRCEDARSRHGIEDLEPFGDHLGANPVPADHRQVERSGSLGLDLGTNIGIRGGSYVGHRRIVAATESVLRSDLVGG